MANNGGLDGVMHKSKEQVVAKHEVGCGRWELILRGSAMLLTLGATIVLGLDKQTKLVPFKLSPDLQPFMIPVVAKYHYTSAFVYSVVANSISCGFAAISLVLTFTCKGDGLRVSRMVIFIADMLILALLFSSIGASSGVGIIGLKGNSHLQWKKVCNVFEKFCHQVFASIVLSFLGAQAFLLLVIMVFWKLYKRA